MAEVSSFLRMMEEVYNVFGLQYKMALSTRPDDYMGELEQWDKAEAALTDALNASGKEWEVRTWRAGTGPPTPSALMYMSIVLALHGWMKHVADTLAESLAPFQIWLMYHYLCQPVAGTA